MNAAETKICLNCDAVFTIELEDFAFYGKLNVPPPTRCPRCRLRRRLSFMNERSLYRSICAHCGKKILSVFSPGSRRLVYCPACWWSDVWDPMDYGTQYDFSRPFFAQYRELLERIPHPSRETVESTLVNSDYCNITSYLKNSYLVFNSDYDEDCAYSSYLERSSRCVDITMGDLSELCYESHNIYKCNRVIFSDNCNECVDVAFSKDCIGCEHCFGCVNLRNKQYYIFNRPFTKETYFQEIEKYDIGSYRVRQELTERLNALSRSLPKRYAHGLKNLNVKGDFIFNSKNVTESYEVTDAKDCKYCHFLFIASTNDAYDFTMWGGGAERVYECMGTGGGQSDIRFCYECWSSDTRNLEYCMYSQGSDLFGCMGVRKKQYCILNKQYSKEEYEALHSRILEQMRSMPYIDAKGNTYSYGEFFPSEISPFNYRETMAQMYFPLTQAEVVAQGFNGKHFDEAKHYDISIDAPGLPDNIKDVRDSITDEIIGCVHRGTCGEQCTTAFRITPTELEFYRHMGLPLPRLCPNCRHYARLSDGPGLDFFERQCMCLGQSSKEGHYRNLSVHAHGVHPCTNTFETAYALDRRETVYCEQCYQAETV